MGKLVLNNVSVEFNGKLSCKSSWYNSVLLTYPLEATYKYLPEGENSPLHNSGYGEEEEEYPDDDELGPEPSTNTGVAPKQGGIGKFIVLGVALAIAALGGTLYALKLPPFALAPLGPQPSTRVPGAPAPKAEAPPVAKPTAIAPVAEP